MAKRANRPKDINQLAAHILEEAVGQPPEIEPTGDKNPAAVALGRLGGLKGGKARAKSLSAKKRAQIAKRAAAARWKKAKS